MAASFRDSVSVYIGQVKKTNRLPSVDLNMIIWRGVNECDNV